MKKFDLTGFEIDTKRFRLPHQIKIPCPKCGEEMMNDMEHNQYLAYPIIGENLVGMYCDECGDSYQLEVKLCIALEYDPEKLTKY